jgi:membrane protein
MKFRTIGAVKQTLHDFSEHNVMQLAAAMAYNAVFALAPFLLVIVGVAGIVLGQESVRLQVEQHLRGMIGGQSTGIVESMMGAATKHSHSIIATVLGTAALLLGAAGLFGQLQGALDTIWQVKPKPGRGIKGMIHDRFLSLAMVFGICFLLLISMILSTILAASSAAIGRALHLPVWIGHVVDFVFSVGMLTVLFAAMFKFLPDVKIPWRNVWGGGLATAVLFSIGKWGLAMYLGRASTSSAYGAAGSFVIILMWIYYASVIVFLGAELTQVVTRQSGVKVRPTENAMPQQPQAATPAPANAEQPRRERPRHSAIGAVLSAAVLVKLVIAELRRARRVLTP